MHTVSLPSIGQSITEDIEGFRFPTALARLADPKDGGALAPALAGLLRARALLGLEQRRAAYDGLQQVRGMRSLTTQERLLVQVETARVLRLGWWSTDYALELAVAAADQAARTEAKALAVDAHLEAALLFGRKRCRELSSTHLARAEALGVHAPRILATRGELALRFDARPAARDAYAAVLAHAEAEDEKDRAAALRLGHLGLANLHTVLGDFALAREHLAEYGEAPKGDLFAQRVALRLFSAQADWAEAARVMAEILEVSPDGDGARGLMLDRASALYRVADLDGARAAWTRIAATGSGDWAARRAAGILDTLGAGDNRRAHLHAFPSVTQLRDHCGPASVELCMRFFGTTAEQVMVAREIKHPDGGTPVHRMRAYMQAAGFHTRRIEADLPRLKDILDAGIPVIIEEDYSTSRHVAVAIGYDNRRALLEVQDPMTHEVRETDYEGLAKLREFSNHGALVAVPEHRTDLIEALDRIGAHECAYISKTDLAWAAHDEDRDDDAERLVDEAIALHEPYELAWVLRFVRARRRYDRESNPETERGVGAVLDAILRLWPDDEWPQQFLGRLRDVQGRTGEALAAFERARDRDPDDADNWCAIGDCKLALGDRGGAREAFENALRRDPGHTRSNENLADVAFDAGDSALASLLNDCARELAPKNAFNWHVYGRILADREQLLDAIAAYDRAIELRPTSTGFVVERARLLARAGRIDDALAGLQALHEQRPEDTFVLTNLADIAYAYDRFDTSLVACEAFAKLDPRSPTPLAIGGAAKCGRGELEAGLTDLRAALARRPTYAWAHREIGSALARVGRWDEAITACAANVGLTSSSADALFRLGDTMAKAGFGRDGLGYLRRAARSGFLDERQLVRVAAVLHEVEGVGAANDAFVALRNEHPRAIAIVKAHAHLLLERIWAPGAAVAVLSALSELAPQHPWVLANSADDLMSASLAGEARGEALFVEAIAAAPELVAPRRFFARQLNARGRFAQALEVLAPCPPSADTLADRVHAWLGLEREAEAVAAIEAWSDTAAPEHRDARRRPLAYKVAVANRRWEVALELATALAADAGELDDDGRLGRWEESRFECLVELGRGAEAEPFGRSQCGTPRELGRLAYIALASDDRGLAARLATDCHAKDPCDAYGLTVLARLADHDGDTARATALWEKMKQHSKWHIHDENLGRLALATGDLPRARVHLEAAVASGHTCPDALQLRAELRLREGDRAGALADAERAWACVPLERRARSGDLRGLVAGLHGKADESRAAFDAWREGTRRAASDDACHVAVREALGL